VLCAYGTNKGDNKGIETQPEGDSNMESGQ
jgi:hypothetical protein